MYEDTLDIENTLASIHEAVCMSDPCDYQMNNTEHVSAKLLLPFFTVQ